MALIIDIGDMSEEKWYDLHLQANSEYESIDMYLVRMYEAIRVKGDRYQFPNKEKYTEFMLKWM